MRRALRLLFVVGIAVGGLVALPATAVSAGEPTTTTTTELPPAPNIIPEPNSGTPPTDAGDRGGALQILLFFLLIGGVGLIAFLIWRESRKARAERGF